MRMPTHSAAVLARCAAPSGADHTSTWASELHTGAAPPVLAARPAAGRRRRSPRRGMLALILGELGGDHGCVGRAVRGRAVDRHRRAELRPGARVPRCRRAVGRVADQPRRRPAVRVGVGGRHRRRRRTWTRRRTSPEMSANKRSVGLELKHPAARDAALALLRDGRRVRHQLLDACRAGARARPRGRWPRSTRSSIYVALPGFGSDPVQPYYEFLAWGPNQAPLVGLDELTGYPDQVPAGHRHHRPARLLRRPARHDRRAHRARAPRSDRRGQRSSTSPSSRRRCRASARSSSTTTLTGAVPQRSGNRLAWLAPQGCYRCVGEDAWVAITVDDDAAVGRRWPTLLGGAAGDARFTTLAGRLEHHDEIDELIEAWTSTQSATTSPSRPPGRRRSPRARCATTAGVLARSAGPGAAVVPAASGRRGSPTATCSAVTRSASAPSRGVVASRAVDGRGHRRRADRRRRHVAGRGRRSCSPTARRSSTPRPR